MHWACSCGCNADFAYFNFTTAWRYGATEWAIVLQVRLRGYDESENFTCLCQEVRQLFGFEAGNKM